MISWAQLIWPAVLLWRASRLETSRLWLWLGLAGNAIVIAVYVASRTVGLPFGPDLHNALVALPAAVIAATPAVMTPGWAGPDGQPDMQVYGSTAPPTAAQVVAAAQLINQTDTSLKRYANVQAAFAVGYTYVLKTNGEGGTQLT